MQQPKTLQLVTQGPVHTLHLTSPSAENRINHTMVSEFLALIDRLQDGTESAVLVIRGTAGQFCGGMDWDNFARGRGPQIDNFGKWERIIAGIEKLSRVTVAVVEGPCIGAGLELALACDYRLAAEDAYIRVSEVRAGLLPSNLTYQLAKYVGLGTAKRLLLTGEPWSASAALQVGIFDRVVPAAELETSIREVVDLFEPVNPVSLAMARRLLHESYSTQVEDAVGNFLAAQHRCLSLSDPPAEDAPHSS
jgi:enoyl-CoA hydratase/carnithine racemase